MPWRAGIAWIAVLLSGCAASTPEAPGVRLVWGAVYSAAGSSVANDAQVYIPSLNIGALTDSRGRFVIRDVPEGRWTLRIERICYVTTDLEIDTGGDGLQIDSIFVPHIGYDRIGDFYRC